MSPISRNITGREACGACDDSGWVELAGTETVGGVTYSRGMAPCKWCELGRKHFEHHNKPGAGHGRYIPETDFGAADIVVPPPRRGRFTPDTVFLIEREAAGESIPAMQLIFPKAIWPEHWPAPPPPQRLDDLQPVGAESPPDVDDEPIPADRTPQDAVSAPRADDPDLGHAETMLPDDVEVPF